MAEHPNALSYRHWFFIALLILINVIIFGCVILRWQRKCTLGSPFVRLRHQHQHSLARFF
jgi:hypothetical protein